jgi:acetyl-CoA C-acetyltransferase
MAADADTEAIQGATFATLNAILTSLYMERYGYTEEDFAVFSVNAHANACNNEFAMFRKPITTAAYLRTPIVSSPLRTLDSPPICDGAAAVVLARHPVTAGRRVVRLASTAGATDTIALASRQDPLWLGAANLSAERALRNAGIDVGAVDFFELHDAFPIMAALGIEGCGFAERGQAVRFAGNGGITRNSGKLPIQTMGGLKARGHPIGATGIYQGVEAYIQLCGNAGGCQVAGAKVALTQNIGGAGAVAFTSVFVAEN